MARVSYLVILGFLALAGALPTLGYVDRAQVFTTSCLTTSAVPNQLYTGRVRAEATILYMFSLPRPRRSLGKNDPKNVNIRIETSVGMEAVLRCPVIFVINQKEIVTSLSLPFSYTNSSLNYYQASRTLCVPDLPDMRNITIRVSSCSTQDINYSLKLSYSEDYLLPLNQDVRIQVSPTSPVVKGFLFRTEQVSTVKILAVAKDLNCMTVSIQPIECPVFDQEWNIKYEGQWQTMTTKAAMTVESAGRLEHGFAVILVVHNTDDLCYKHTADSLLYKQYQTREKQITLRVSTDGQVPAWKLFFALMIPVMGSLAIVLVALILFRLRHGTLSDKIQAIDVTDSYILRNKPNRLSPLESEGEEGSPLNSTNSLPGYETEEGTADPGDPESEAVFSRRLPVINSEATIKPIRDRFVLRADVHVGDFTRSSSTGKVVLQKARRFCWSLITVSIFYTIPVYQLIFHYLRVLKSTGEYDMCYYNYLCAFRVGYLIDFNHFFSNIGYVIFGSAFMFIVRRREVNLVYVDAKGQSSKENRLSRPTSTMELQVKLAEEGKKRCFCFFPIIETKTGYGVPQQFGVFYALGLALIMEGFLSAAYHVCPNQHNFQFDTCFMYVISVLTILKVYQFRHPVTLDASQVFAILAGIVLVSVFGLMLEFRDANSKLLFGFRIIFTVAQFLLLLSICTYYYSVGYVRDNTSKIVTDLKVFTGIKQVYTRPVHCDRLILPFITFLLCIAVVVYSELVGADFSTYLLYTFVANVLGSCLYYIFIMKPIHGEFKDWMWVQPVLYFLACGVVGGFAVTYFVQAPAQWEKSASESRSENNVECMNAWFPFQPFYDVHDVWHFYSAAALFLAFMGLLTVDDDLIATPQNRIPVF